MVIFMDSGPLKYIVMKFFFMVIDNFLFYGIVMKNKCKGTVFLLWHLCISIILWLSYFSSSHLLLVG